MSALPRINGARNLSAAPGTAYDDLRNKVAALVRPERPVSGMPKSILNQPVLRPTLEETSPALPTTTERAEITRDPGNVFDILSRATSCFDLLSQKLDQVEGERDEALSQIEDHKRAAVSWQEMIETVQSRMQDAERDMAEMRHELAAQRDRAEKAEGRVSELQNTLKARDQRLNEIEKQYANLYDQVISSFGLGSTTQRILEGLAQKFHAKAA